MPAAKRPTLTPSKIILQRKPPKPPASQAVHHQTIQKNLRSIETTPQTSPIRHVFPCDSTPRPRDNVPTIPFQPPQIQEVQTAILQAQQSVTLASPQVTPPKPISKQEKLTNFFKSPEDTIPTTNPPKAVVRDLPIQQTYKFLF